jgi:ribonuclease P protein component
MRLNTRDVTNVLKRGKRVRPVVSASAKAVIDARVLGGSDAGVVREGESRAKLAPKSGARIAIAVPKRLLKKAVERNLVKRWIREALRQHGARLVTADMLLTLTAKVNLKDASEKVRLKQQISDLFVRVEALSSTRKIQAHN